MSSYHLIDTVNLTRGGPGRENLVGFAEKMDPTAEKYYLESVRKRAQKFWPDVKLPPQQTKPNAVITGSQSRTMHH